MISKQDQVKSETNGKIEGRYSLISNGVFWFFLNDICFRVINIYGSLSLVLYNNSCMIKALVQTKPDVSSLASSGSVLALVATLICTLWLYGFVMLKCYEKAKDIDAKVDIREKIYQALDYATQLLSDERKKCSVNVTHLLESVDVFLGDLLSLGVILIAGYQTFGVAGVLLLKVFTSCLIASITIGRWLCLLSVPWPSKLSLIISRHKFESNVVVAFVIKYRLLVSIAFVISILLGVSYGLIGLKARMISMNIYRINHYTIPGQSIRCLDCGNTTDLSNRPCRVNFGPEKLLLDVEYFDSYFSDSREVSSVKRIFSSTETICNGILIDAVSLCMISSGCLRPPSAMDLQNTGRTVKRTYRVSNGSHQIASFDVNESVTEYCSVPNFPQE